MAIVHLIWMVRSDPLQCEEISGIIKNVGSHTLYCGRVPKISYCLLECLHAYV